MTFTPKPIKNTLSPADTKKAAKKLRKKVKNMLPFLNDKQLSKIKDILVAETSRRTSRNGSFNLPNLDTQEL